MERLFDLGFNLKAGRGDPDLPLCNLAAADIAIHETVVDEELSSANGVHQHWRSLPLRKYYTL